jgi:hypothetical protein
MTLIEILIVIALIGVIFWAFGPGLNSITKFDLRSDATRVAAAMRTAADRAAASATFHRVVIDLDEDTFVVEECKGSVKMVRSVDEARAQEQAGLLAQAEAMARLQAEKVKEEASGEGLASNDSGMIGEATEAGQQLKKLQDMASTDSVGASAAAMQCSRAKRTGDRNASLSKKKKISFKQVWVSHLEKPVTEGQVTINFLPTGRGERAIVIIEDGNGSALSLELHGLTGRVEIHEGELDRPEDVLRGTGNSQVMP